MAKEQTTMFSATELAILQGLNGPILQIYTKTCSLCPKQEASSAM